MSLSNLAEILAKIGDGLCVLNKNGEVNFVNELAGQILGAADAEFHTRLARAVKEQVSIRFDHFHSALHRWFEHRAFANEDGGMTLVSRDITSRHRIEEALRASDERFHRLTESNIIGVVSLDGEFIIEANDVFLRMIGYTRSEMVTRQLRWREMTPPEYDARDAEARQELASAGMFSPYEKEFLHKSGGRVPIFIGGVAAGNEPAEALCFVLDLSERKRADQRIRSIVEGSKILASSLEYETTFPQLAAFIAQNLADSCTIFVKEDGRLIRMAATLAVPLTPAAAAAADMNELDAAGVVETGDCEICLSPTSRVLVPIVARSEVAGVLAVTAARPDAFNPEDLRLFDELARRSGLALENARMYHETQRANRLKDEFVAIVSHELRTPLTPILGGVYMLRSEPHDEGVVAWALDLIERNAKTQKKIVDDLLDVSRALSGKLRLNMGPVDLPAVIRSAVDTVRPAGDAKGIHIDVHAAPVYAVVLGDPDRLQQIVWNLLANSVKFTPPSGNITIELAQMPNCVEIRVTDSGIGINLEFLPHVFERFRQADASRTRLHGGLGLGLAIVRHLVESHGGTIHAHSSGTEQGSTFTVRLPIRAPRQAAAAG